MLGQQVRQAELEGYARRITAERSGRLDRTAKMAAATTALEKP